MLTLYFIIGIAVSLFSTISVIWLKDLEAKNLELFLELLPKKESQDAVKNIKPFSTVLYSFSFGIIWPLFLLFIFFSS